MNVSPWPKTGSAIRLLQRFFKIDRGEVCEP